MKRTRMFRTLMPLAIVGLLAAWANAQTRPAQPPATAPTGSSFTVRDMSMLDLFSRGGFFMIPIGGCSLMGLALIIERLWSLRRGKIMPRSFMPGLRMIMGDKAADPRAGLRYCRSHDSPISRVVASGIAKLPRGEEAVEQAIEDVGANEVSKLRRNLRLLFGVSAVAPLLGLLGTVSGMIKAFQVAEVIGTGHADQLAKGIYEALVTTYAGLLVAIPVLVFYYYFQGKIERIVSEMNDMSILFVEQYAASPAANESPAANVAHLDDDTTVSSFPTAL